jgi:predicted nucleotidyltransferase component of viral defense system
VKVEFNTREPLAVLGTTELPFAVESRWFNGRCQIVSFPMNELLATKLRALYQRRKGRDLFDLWYGITAGKAEPVVIVDTFRKYMEAEGHPVSQQQYRQNLAEKMKNARFLGDTADFLRPDVGYDHEQAYRLVDQQVLARL